MVGGGDGTDGIVGPLANLTGRKAGSPTQKSNGKFFGSLSYPPGGPAASFLIKNQDKGKKSHLQQPTGSGPGLVWSLPVVRPWEMLILKNCDADFIGFIIVTAV